MTEVAGLRTQEVVCHGCQKTIFVESPVLDVVNKPEYSMIVFSHQRLEKCPHCGQSLSAAIVNLNKLHVELAWLPVTIKPQAAQPDNDQTDAKILVRPSHAKQ